MRVIHFRHLPATQYLMYSIICTWIWLDLVSCLSITAVTGHWSVDIMLKPWNLKLLLQAEAECCWCWLVALYSFSHQFTFCIFTLQWDILCDVLRGWACTSPASPPSLGRDNNRYRINKLFCWSTTNLSATWYLIQTFLFRNFVVILVSTNPAPATAHCQRCQWMVIILNILFLTSEP